MYYLFMYIVLIGLLWAGECIKYVLFIWGIAITLCHNKKKAYLHNSLLFIPIKILAQFFPILICTQLTQHFVLKGSPYFLTDAFKTCELLLLPISMTPVKLNLNYNSILRIFQLTMVTKFLFLSHLSWFSPLNIYLS